MKDFTKVLKYAFPFTIPVLIGYMFLGAAYGILMSVNGFGVHWSLLMSLIAFCGSMQYVAITLLLTSFNPIYTLLITLMVNARHIFYGISMLDKYRNTGILKPFLIFTMSDETFSILCSYKENNDIDKRYFLFAVSFLNYIYWALGTLIGGIIGSQITFNTKGLDFVLTALFVVIFLEQWLEQKDRRPALIGVICSLISLIIFKNNIFIIVSMFLILLVITIIYNLENHKKLKKENKNE